MAEELVKSKDDSKKWKQLPKIKKPWRVLQCFPMKYKGKEVIGVMGAGKDNGIYMVDKDNSEMMKVGQFQEGLKLWSHFVCQIGENEFMSVGGCWEENHNLSLLKWSEEMGGYVVIDLLKEKAWNVQVPHVRYGGFRGVFMKEWNEIVLSKNNILYSIDLRFRRLETCRVVLNEKDVWNHYVHKLNESSILIFTPHNKIIKCEKKKGKIKWNVMDVTPLEQMNDMSLVYGWKSGMSMPLCMTRRVDCCCLWVDL